MIRMLQHADAQELFTLVEDNRQYLRSWLPWLDHNKTVKDTCDFIASTLKDYADYRSMVHAIVKHGAIVGVCGFNSINHNIRSGTLGYWLSEKMQGKGYALNACRAIEEIGFNQINLNKIEIQVAVENLRSRNLAEKLGYVETGRVHDAEWLYDHYVDHVIYCKKNPANA